MKYIDKLFTIVLSSILFQCSFNDPVLTLSENLIGYWSDGKEYSIKFFENGTFKDTSLYINYYPSPDTTFVMRSGTYQLNENILSIKDFIFDEVRLASSGIGSISAEYEIEIANNTMIRTYIKSLDPVGENKNELWGSWKYSYMVLGYNASGEYNSVPLLYETTYAFIKDSSKFKCKYEYLSPNQGVSVHWYDYTYTPPILNLPVSNENNLFVEFKNKKMYWIYNSDKKKLYKKL